MEAGRRRKYQRKDENKATPSFDRRGSVPMIHCCHVGFIMSAAGLHHFLLLGVSRPGEQTGRSPVQRSAGHRKHSHWKLKREVAETFWNRDICSCFHLESALPTLLHQVPAVWILHYTLYKHGDQNIWRAAGGSQKTNERRAAGNKTNRRPAAPHLIVTCRPLSYWVQTDLFKKWSISQMFPGECAADGQQTS